MKMIYQIITNKRWTENETTVKDQNFERRDERSGAPTYTVDVKYKEHESNAQWKEELSFSDSDELLSFIQEKAATLDLSVETNNFKFLKDLYDVYETISK